MNFNEKVAESYNFEEQSIELGSVVNNGEVFSELKVKLPLRMLNRHGLITGATGTGKTKTVQILVERLSLAGIPSLVMDIKGDMSGIAAAGENHPKIIDRHKAIGLPFDPQAVPCEFLTLSNEAGVKLRATLLEFGPVLFSKILELNTTQNGVVSVIFKYCDDHALPLIDLEDFKEVLRFIGNYGKVEFEKLYGHVSSASISTILRKVIELEQNGAGTFMGEPSFEVEDLLKVNEQGLGVVSVLRLMDVQTKPKLFSTFMLSLLAEIYANFPEVGDVEKPKLALFIDEAHLVFDQASQALVEQLEQIVRLIRSKGVGVYFCTQNSSDIPENVLSQLGMKIQHALRAFTAKDRENIKKIAANFPLSDFYDVEQLITDLGIGEALFTCLDKKGRPSELVHLMLRAPVSRMGTLNNDEVKKVIESSQLLKKYDQELNKESAFELLNTKIKDEHVRGLGRVSKVESSFSTPLQS